MNLFEHYKRLSVRIFGNLARKSALYFSSLKPHLMGASIHVLLETWIAIIYLTTLIAYFGSLISVFAISVFIPFDSVTFLYIVIFIPVMASSMVLLFLYIYPVQKSSRIRNSIDNNLPFALAHMSAIASSGIPPEFMFELLTGFKEYGEISKQAGLIVRNIKTFGMSSVNAISDVARRTPSPSFKQVLMGIQSSIEKGGNLTAYLEEMSNRSLFEYRIKRENYANTLSAYADFYAAVLITAPIMMIVVLGVMSIIGGDVMGFAATDLIFLMTWLVIPLLNILFIAFLHITYPGS
ncbi:MAG: type II secretion system F family protein [Candidatus Aenigmarchaeota archaeon]|nr:type II secretion system F family protein [Candidatus Aenigmarchaeota archaeon]